MERHWCRGEVGAVEAVETTANLSVHRSSESGLTKRTAKETLRRLNFSVSKSHLQQRAVLQLQLVSVCPRFMHRYGYIDT